MQAYWFVRIDMPFLSIINQTIYNMDKNKIHGFMDQLNLFLIGAVIGGIIGSCFSINAVKGKSNKAEEKVRAYERYYKCTETLLDSLDGTHDLDLMDTDLETDYGVNYLEAKSKVDELIAKQNGETQKNIKYENNRRLHQCNTNNISMQYFGNSNQRYNYCIMFKNRIV